MRPYGRIGVDVPAFGTSDVVTHAPYMITGLCVGEGHAPPVALASLAHAATDHARKSTLDGSGATGEACLSPTGTAGMTNTLNTTANVRPRCVCAAPVIEHARLGDIAGNDHRTMRRGGACPSRSLSITRARGHGPCTQIDGGWLWCNGRGMPLPYRYRRGAPVRHLRVSTCDAL